MKLNVDKDNPPAESPALLRSPGKRAGVPAIHWPWLGFTLIEFILVMALLAVVMAFSAPSLSRFFRQRYLQEDATRFVALTEYGRNEAISQGFPMIIWIDPQLHQYGLEAKSGFPAPAARHREYTLHKDVQFDLGNTASSRNELVQAAEFAPDGYLEIQSLEALWLTDRFGAELVVAQTTNGWGYEILKTADYASRQQRR